MITQVKCHVPVAEYERDIVVLDINLFGVHTLITYHEGMTDVYGIRDDPRQRFTLDARKPTDQLFLVRLRMIQCIAGSLKRKKGKQTFESEGISVTPDQFASLQKFIGNYFTPA
jgi:hypothetical protein